MCSPLPGFCGRSCRLLIVCSAGGHLMEALLATEGVVKDFEVATFRLPHLSAPPGARALHFLIDPHTSLWKYAVNAIQSLVLLLRVRPQVILTTGAGIAIASVVLGKCLGARVIVVETAACVQRPSRTGALLYRFADLFIVQWPELLSHYPRAVYGGALL
jgi:beta-1,4-N-acetylglucosaminyltransferase